MDPVSMAASIGSICAVAAKLIGVLSEFVDDVHSAPTEVQALSNEIARLYSNLGQARIAIEIPRLSPLPEQWTKDFEGFMKDCSETLEQLRTIVNKAKRTESGRRSATEMWRTVKFTFKEKQIKVLRARLLSQNGILANMLLVLAETRGIHLEKRLEDVHGMVASLLASRANVKETLVVIANEDDDSERSAAADYVLSDRRRKEPRATNLETSAERLTSTETSDPPAQGLEPVTNTESTDNAASQSKWNQFISSEDGKAALAGAADVLADYFYNQRKELDTETQQGFRPSRSEDEDVALIKAATASWPIEKLTRQKTTNAAETQGFGEASSSSDDNAYDVRIVASHTLSLSFIKKVPNNMSSNSSTTVGEGVMILPYFTLLRTNRNVTIKPQRLKSSLPSNVWDSVSSLESDCQIQMEFVTDASAVEFCDCLKTLQRLHQRAWEQRTIATSCLLKSMLVNTRRKLEVATADDIRLHNKIELALAANDFETTMAFGASSLFSAGSSIIQPHRDNQLFSAPITPAISSTLSIAQEAEKARQQEFVEAAKDGRTAQVSTLLATHVAIDGKYGGWTALGRAAEAGQLEVVKILVNHGANLNIRMDVGWGFLPGDGSALNWAAKGGYIEIVNFLISRGGDVNIHAKKAALRGNGGTPVSMAAEHDHLKVVQALIAAGADVGSQNPIGWDAFMIACEKGSLSVVEYFVKTRRLDGRRKHNNNDGWTALHMATVSQKPAVLTLLVDHGGARVNDTDDNGNTPLHIAASKGLRRSVVWLRRRGTSLNARNRAGQTPLDIARARLASSSTDANRDLVKYCDWSEPVPDAQEESECIVM